MEASKKLCPRPLYLNKIRPFRDDCEMIKVLVGVRRCGKSSIMELIRRELENEGAPKENLLFLNLDAKENIDIHTPKGLMRKIDALAKAAKPGIKYLFIDEVQNVKDFEKVVNAYREEGGFSVFITGSNGYLLSGQLATKLTGRYMEFHIGTLLFSEYLAMKRFLNKPVQGNMDVEFNEYILNGGFPRSVEYDDPAAKRDYAKEVIREIYQKDVLTNKTIKNGALFEQVQRYVINNFGAIFSARSLAEELSKTNGVVHSMRTIYHYLEILEKAQIISRCERFDLKSKKSLAREEKFYLADLSFYFASNVDNRVNYGPVLENIVFNYAKCMGYEASIGKIGRLEVDFILRKGWDQYAYVQVAKTIDNGIYDENGVPKTEEREYRPLESIRDNYPKFVLTMDHLLQHRNGVVHANLIEFLQAENPFLR